MSKNTNLKPYIDLLTFLSLSDGFDRHQNNIVKLYFSGPAVGMDMFKNEEDLELIESKINLLTNDEDFFAGKALFSSEKERKYVNHWLSCSIK